MFSFAAKTLLNNISHVDCITTGIVLLNQALLPSQRRPSQKDSICAVVFPCECDTGGPKMPKPLKRSP